MHAFGFSGHPSTSSGWPSFYLEDMLAHAQAFQAHLASMVFEGLFERSAGAEVRHDRGRVRLGAVAVLAAGQAVAADAGRDAASAEGAVGYIRSQVWFTTQPMEEPADKQELEDAIGWLGWDRLLFASDYPHWDYDNPDVVLPIRVEEDQRARFFRGNAKVVYGV